MGQTRFFVKSSSPHVCPFRWKSGWMLSKEPPRARFCGLNQFERNKRLVFACVLLLLSGERVLVCWLLRRKRLCPVPTKQAEGANFFWRCRIYAGLLMCSVENILRKEGTLDNVRFEEHRRSSGVRFPPHCGNGEKNSVARQQAVSTPCSFHVCTLLCV
jgi:hypothetical protein